MNNNPDDYFGVNMFLGSISLLGFLFNVWLYIDDIRNRNGILDKVTEIND